MNKKRLAVLAEDLGYFREVINTVFTEEPNEGEIIGITSLLLTYLRKIGKEYLDPGSCLRDNIKRVIKAFGIEVKGSDSLLERCYSKKDLYKTANATYYWEKPGYIG